MKRQHLNRLRALILVLIVATLAVLYQRGLFPMSGELKDPSVQTAEAAPTAPPQATPVRACVVRLQSLSEEIAVSGSTVASDEVTISPEVAGTIVELAFKEGAVVQKGQLLARLDDTELNAQLNRLEVQAELNGRIADRLKGLYERQGVSLQDYEVAVAEHEKSLAEITLVEAQLSKREIRAPFRGMLGLKQVSTGAYLGPGAPIVSLVSYDPLKVEFSVPEKYSTSITPGTPVTVEVGYLEAPLSGLVEASDPVIDPATRTWKLRAVVANPEGKVLPGAFAQVRVKLREFESTAVVPTQAIVPELGGKKIFVAKGGIAQAVSVTTGIRQETMIQVLSGLNEGDTVITSGILQIRDGSPVSITELQENQLIH